MDTECTSTPEIGILKFLWVLEHITIITNFEKWDPHFFSRLFFRKKLFMPKYTQNGYRVHLNAEIAILFIFRPKPQAVQLDLNSAKVNE